MPYIHYNLEAKKSFSFWYDLWINGKDISDLFPNISIKDTKVRRVACVSEAWREGRQRLPNPLNDVTQEAWNEVKKNNGETIREDEIIWVPSKTSKYTIIIKSGWEVLCNKRQNVSQGHFGNENKA